MTDTSSRWVRWMIRRDLPEVVEIDWLSEEPLAWTSWDFTDFLRKQSHMGMVAERDETVQGFVMYRRLKDRISITRLAVHPAWRRRGVGSLILSRMIHKLPLHERGLITATVREGALPAQKLLRAHGFLATGVRRAFYENGEDAYRFTYKMKE